MSNIPSVLAGVAEAIAEAGEPLTIKRSVMVTDPNKPTQPGTLVTTVYTCLGYVGPVSAWNPASLQREITTDCYIDPLSLRDEDDEQVNTPSTLTVITEEGDVVIDGAGKEWVMTRESHPRIEGRIALFWHVGLA